MARSAQLAGHLTAREFRVRYSSTLLGWIWAVAPPFVRLLVLGLVFTRVLPVDAENYLALLAVGLLGWTWFSSGVANATRSSLDRRELLLQPGLPRQVVPVVSILTDGLDYLAALPVLLGIVALSTGGLPLTALLFPLLLLPLLALTLGLGMAASSLDVRFRDTRLFVDLLLAVGFYATPVFYTFDSIPESTRDLLGLNPVARLLDAQRDVLVDGVLPAPGPLAVVVLACLLVLVVGWGMHRRAADTFLDDM